MEQKAGILVGIDIGGTNIRAAAITASARVLGRSWVATSLQHSCGAFADTLVRLVHETLSRVGLEDDCLMGIGIGCTGPVNPERGTVHNPYTLPIPGGCDIATPLGDHYSVPVVLENDADAAALAESWLGAGIGRELVVYVCIGTGVGAGIVRRGAIVRGSQNSHPEIGHHVVAMEGPSCYCGLRGCWESFASGPAIARAGVELAGEGGSQVLLDLAGGQISGIDSEVVFDAAQRGDRAASQIIEQAVLATTIGIANIVHFYAPDAVVLGGGVMHHYALFEPSIRRMLSTITMVPVEGLLVSDSRLGQDAGPLGAALAARSPER